MIQAAALCAEAATFPIDGVKTRMQVHKGAATFRHVLQSSVAAQGWASLYRGLQPAVVRHFIYSATRVVLYEDIRNGLAGWQGNVGAAAPLWAKMAAGFTAGGLGQLLASPADLVKVRLQTAAVVPGSTQYAGVADCIRRTMAQEGVGGFFRGWRPNVTRACLVNLGELATYDEAKRAIMRHSGLSDGLPVHVGSALASGFFAALCSTPADVCKSRVMSGMYPGMLACLVGTVRAEGLPALWKGFVPNWLRLGPWQFVFWITYEGIRLRVVGSGF